MSSQRVRHLAQAEGLLFDLGDQGVADHDLRHSSGEFQNVVPHPVRRLLVRGKCFIGAVKSADSDQQIWAAIEQIVAPEAGHLSQQGQEPSSTRRANSSTEPCLTLYFLMLVNMFFPVTGSLAGSPRPCRETVRCIIARHVPARLMIEPNTANLIETIRTVGRFSRWASRSMAPRGSTAEPISDLLRFAAPASPGRRVF
jgi:hypothetical protein